MKTNALIKTLTVLLSYVIALVALLTQAKGDDFSFSAKVSGSGQSMILIPGLSCSGDVWNETVDRYSNEYECHQLTLAGFANVAPTERDSSFCNDTIEEILAYIEVKDLKNPIIVGHSLGGFIALKLSSENPDLASSLVIVDSLPFLPAIYNPAATVESARPMAEQTKTMMSNNPTTPESAKMILQPMVTAAEDIETISQWMIASDSTSVIDAMYELYTTDLRQEIANIKAPTLVLGAWVGYQQFGATRESTSGLFNTQYTQLPNYQLAMTDKGKHFIMMDDPEFFFSQIDTFLSKAD